MANHQETSGCRKKRVDAGVYIKASVITERTDLSLVTQGWVCDKPCLMTVARPNITAGWPERQPHQYYVLQTVSGEALPILKEVFLTLYLGRGPLKILVFTNITNKFTLGLDILHTYDISVALGHQTLCLAEEEVSLWSASLPA